MLITYQQFHLVFQRYLSGIDSNELNNRISAFRNLIYTDLSEKEIKDKIYGILKVDINGSQKIHLMSDSFIYPKGTLFYRVRDLENNENKIISIPLKTITIEKDVWNPPVGCKMQRFNNNKESVLYTTPEDESIPIKEKKIPDDDNFILIKYEAKIEIKVTPIGLNPTILGLTVEEKHKLQSINNFLNDMVTLDVCSGAEYLYKVSNVISKHYFGASPEYSDGWCYPSLKDRSKSNVCFHDQDIKEKLNFKYFLVCSKEETENGIIIKNKYVSILKNDIFKYFKVGSEEQKRLFPEVKDLNKIRLIKE